jgi:AraC family transcriptional regulator
MALRDGLRAGRADDAMYGESLSLALAVHLLRRYAAVSAGLQRLRGGLSQEKLMLAVAYIQDHLESGLSVSGIARTVHMSPFHFARLFKQSTGKSPYRYVVQARATRAKELLKSSKLSIVEIAHRLGFARQFDRPDEVGIHKVPNCIELRSVASAGRFSGTSQADPRPFEQ